VYIPYSDAADADTWRRGLCGFWVLGERSLSVDWKAVQGIGVSDFGYGKVLTFAFRDPEEVKSQMTPEQRARAEANEAAGIPTLTIQQGALDTDVDEIRTISSRFFFAVG